MNNDLKRFNDSPAELCLCEPGKCAWAAKPHPNRVYFDWAEHTSPSVAPFAGFYLRCPAINQACEMPKFSGSTKNVTSQSHGVICPSTTCSGRRCMPSRERDWSLARFRVSDQSISSLVDPKPIAFGTVDYILPVLARHPPLNSLLIQGCRNYCNPEFATFVSYAALLHSPGAV